MLCIIQGVMIPLHLVLLKFNNDRDMVSYIIPKIYPRNVKRVDFRPKWKYSFSSYWLSLFYIRSQLLTSIFSAVLASDQLDLGA